MNLHQSIKRESKKRDIINKAKQEFKREYTKIAGYAFYPEDLSLTEDQVLNWYKTELKLKAIIKKHTA